MSREKLGKTATVSPFYTPEGGNPVFKNFKSMIEWSPIIPKDQVPSFLEDYQVVRFEGTEPRKVSELVHRLYHTRFTDDHDRSEILPSLQIGETLAILTSDQRIPVAAVTFVERSCAVAIFFLCTSLKFECMGMGSLLLSLLLNEVRSRAVKAATKIVFF
jgi:hypothetical protein